MHTQHLIDATGLIALSLNLSAYVRPNDRRLLKTGALASALWAVNNLLIGAPTAAALSVLGAGRQASAAALRDRSGHVKALAFAALVAVTLLVAGLTWRGTSGLLAVAGSLAGTYAMFYLRGAALRWAMVVVSVVWMGNGLAHDAGWQIVANGLCGAAAAVAAWRTRLPVADARSA